MASGSGASAGGTRSQRRAAGAAFHRDRGVYFRSSCRLPSRQVGDKAGCPGVGGADGGEWDCADVLWLNGGALADVRLRP